MTLKYDLNVKLKLMFKCPLSNPTNILSIFLAYFSRNWGRLIKMGHPAYKRLHPLWFFYFNMLVSSGPLVQLLFTVITINSTVNRLSHYWETVELTWYCRNQGWKRCPLLCLIALGFYLHHLLLIKFRFLTINWFTL